MDGRTKHDNTHQHKIVIMEREGRREEQKRRSRVSAAQVRWKILKLLVSGLNKARKTRPTRENRNRIHGCVLVCVVWRWMSDLHLAKPFAPLAACMLSLFKGIVAGWLRRNYEGWTILSYHYPPTHEHWLRKDFMPLPVVLNAAPRSIGRRRFFFLL